MRLLLILSVFFSLYGCVGTVTETADPYTESGLANDIPLYFLGIQKAEAISDTRIEIFFLPASGGSGKYTYDLQVGNEPIPRSYSSDTLSPDYRGLLKITVRNLDPMKSYQLKVEVRDEGSQQQSDSKVIKTVTTFENEVAKFDGILSAYNLPGQDGKDSIKIRWNPAEASSGFPGKNSDPVSYEVVFLNSLKFTPGDFDVQKGPDEGRWKIDIPNDPDQIEKVINGLPSKTKFYVRMRAIHKTSIDNIFLPRYRSEQNSNYITISTLSGSITDLNYQPETFKVQLAPGSQGLNAINTSWAAPTGVFDHYRLYYWKKGSAGDPTPPLPDTCLNPYLSPPDANVWCKKIDYNLSLSAITGLEPYQFYGVKLVLCATSSCSSLGDRAYWAERTIKTDPMTSAFGGINEVIPATNLSEIGSVKIKFSPPDFTNGYFDGLILKVKRSQDNSTVPVEVLDTPSPETSTYFLPYDFLEEDIITVKGIDYLDTSPYCFNLYPFKWNSDSSGRIEFDSDMWQCPVLNIQGPKEEEFQGLESATSEGDKVTLNWKTPTGGIFTHYEIYWTKDTSTQFNWSDAIAQASDIDPNYGKAMILGLLLEPNSDNSYSKNLFADGLYSFGILTYYSYATPNGPFLIRSETNAEIYRCHMNSTPPIELRECVKN